MNTLVFTSKDDANEGFERAKNLVDALVKDGKSARLVQKSGFNLEDLHLVAKHKIVSTPTVLGLKNGKVVYRVLQLPTMMELSNLFNHEI